MDYLLDQEHIYVINHKNIILIALFMLKIKFQITGSEFGVEILQKIGKIYLILMQKEIGQIVE